MSHKCGKTCRRKNGLGHCANCQGSKHRYRSSSSSNGGGAPRPVTGGQPKGKGTLTQQIIAANTLDGRAISAGHPDNPISAASLVCNRCGETFSNHLESTQHYCQPAMGPTVAGGRCVLCEAEGDDAYCLEHRYRIPRPRPTKPLPDLSPSEYAEWCLEMAAPVFSRLQNIPKRVTAEQDAAIRQDYVRCSDLYRIARHYFDGRHDARILFRLNQVGGVAAYPVHLSAADDGAVRIWGSRVAGYMEALRRLLRAGYIVELTPSEFGVPIGHERD